MKANLMNVADWWKSHRGFSSSPPFHHLPSAALSLLSVFVSSISVAIPSFIYVSVSLFVCLFFSVHLRLSLSLSILFSLFVSLYVSASASASASSVNLPLPPPPQPRPLVGVRLRWQRGPEDEMRPVCLSLAAQFQLGIAAAGLVGDDGGSLMCQRHLCSGGVLKLRDSLARWFPRGVVEWEGEYLHQTHFILKTDWSGCLWICCRLVIPLILCSNGCIVCTTPSARFADILFN